MSQEAYCPDTDMPACMMPDGGQACASYARLLDAYNEALKTIERMRAESPAPKQDTGR